MYPTRDETALWVALNLTQRKIYAAIDAALKTAGLPPLRWYDVLWELERAKDCGARAFELEAKLLFQQSNLSRLLQRMISGGLVEEFVFENDRRGKVIRITEKGSAVRKEMWEVYGPLIHKYMSKVPDPHELTNATAALTKIV